jgi:hypothetical protein
MQPEVQWLLIGPEKATRTTRVQLEVFNDAQYDVYYRLKNDSYVIEKNLYVRVWWLRSILYFRFFVLLQCNILYVLFSSVFFQVSWPHFSSFVQGLRFHRDGHASHHRHRPAPTQPRLVVAVVRPPNPGPNRRPTLSGQRRPRRPSTNHLHRCQPSFYGWRWAESPSNPDSLTSNPNMNPKLAEVLQVLEKMEVKKIRVRSPKSLGWDSFPLYIGCSMLWHVPKNFSAVLHLFRKNYGCTHLSELDT